MENNQLLLGKMDVGLDLKKFTTLVWLKAVLSQERVYTFIPVSTCFDLITCKVVIGNRAL